MRIGSRMPRRRAGCRFRVVPITPIRSRWGNPAVCSGSAARQGRSTAAEPASHRFALGARSTPRHATAIAPPGRIPCHGICRDPLTDPLHWWDVRQRLHRGEDLSKPASAFASQVARSCTGVCRRDLLTDRFNCGTCGNTCSPFPFQDVLRRASARPSLCRRRTAGACGKACPT